jgi:hypothetical protein
MFSVGQTPGVCLPGVGKQLSKTAPQWDTQNVAVTVKF